MASSMQDEQATRLARRLSRIAHIVLSCSGKGGVGKSSTAVSLALSIFASHPDARIGLLDVDLTGPSLPRMLGLDGRDVLQSADGWVPVHLYGGDGSSRGLLECMSIGFMLSSTSESVVWRGPKKTAMVRQFLSDVRWGDLDWLIIDTPPGTSDEHISLLESLRPLLMPAGTYGPDVRLPTLSAVLVTTPQAVSISDVSKELSFARRTGLPVLGLIENLSGYACPHCGEVTPVFGRGGGEAFCRLEEEKRERGEGDGCRFLGRVPVDRAFVSLMDNAAEPPLLNNGAAPTNGAAHARSTLLERFQATPTAAVFAPIAANIVDLISQGIGVTAPTAPIDPRPAISS